MSRARDIADGKFANDLTVDTNTLKVDASVNKVGIGTASPDTIADIAGSGVPLEIDSTNSNTYKVQFKNNGTVTSYLGTTSNAFYFGNSSAAQLARLDSDGLKFGTDSAAANALDDYEEGTFEPTFTSSGGNFTNAGYSGDTGGRYIKIGNLVLVTGCARLNGTLDKSNVSSSANLRIGNLPFNNSSRSNGDNADGPHTVRVPVWSSGDVPDRSNMTPGANAITLYSQNNENHVASSILVSDLPNDAMVQFSATYTTN